MKEAPSPCHASCPKPLMDAYDAHHSNGAGSSPWAAPTAERHFPIPDGTAAPPAWNGSSLHLWQAPAHLLSCHLQIQRDANSPARHPAAPPLSRGMTTLQPPLSCHWQRVRNRRAISRAWTPPIAPEALWKLFQGSDRAIGTSLSDRIPSGDGDATVACDHRLTRVW
jgi:hypothetical protein